MKNNIIKKVKEIIKKNDEIAYRLKIILIKRAEKKVGKITDSDYIIKQYKSRTGKSLNLASPITFNEKIQWLKLFYYNSLLNTCVDKYEVREYVNQKIKDQNILIPIYGVYNFVDEIDFKTLPKEFAIKLTNGSSFNYICYNKNKKEVKKIKNRFRKWIDIDYFAFGREVAYKGVKNRIIVEKLLKPNSGNPPEDYRFFCFEGKVRVISVDIDSVINGVKQTKYYRNLYDRSWNKINAQIEFPSKIGLDLPRPKRLNDMVRIVELLSENFIFVRVDLYYFDEQIYFGELTFYHSSGYQSIEPYEFEKQMGDWIDLSKLSNYKQDKLNKDYII